MFVSNSLGVNANGHLTIGERDAVELGQTFGTPLYVMDENQIRNNCRRYKQSIEQYYEGYGLVSFASKAFCCREMCRIIHQEGLGLDVVSGGELYTALSVDFPAERIFFHGNNKTPEELTYAVRSGVGTIVVDHIFELEMLNQIAKSVNTHVNIQFRIKPGVDTHTHDSIKTGCIDSKFGFALETGEAMEAVEMALQLENIHLKGLHCHIGSQIFDVKPFELAAQIMLDFIAQIQKKFGHTIEQLNLGGGFGIQYMPEDKPVAYERYMQSVSKVVHTRCEKLGIPIPFIIIEPGRSIVGSAGVTLYKVGGVKEIPNIRTYVSVDGGMTDNPRYALYKAQYDMLLANKADRPKSKQYTIAGKCCESGDLLGEQVPLQEVQVGDTLAVLATGAYNYSMSSNYNRLPRPAVVMVKDKEARVVVKREDYADIVRNDI